MKEQMGCESLLIRHAEKEDLDAIYSIELSSFQKPYPYTYLELMLILSKYFLVATCDGRIIGYVLAVMHEEKVCHILSIAVEPSFRNRGIGSNMLKHLLSMCCSDGAVAAMLEVDYKNFIAQRFYLNNGFRYVDVLPRYYGDSHGLLMTTLEPCGSAYRGSAEDNRAA